MERMPVLAGYMSPGCSDETCIALNKTPQSVTVVKPLISFCSTFLYPYSENDNIHSHLVGIAQELRGNIGMGKSTLSKVLPF